jgi:DNA-damage-inducible protein J
MTQIVRAQIDDAVKDEADSVLADMGLTASDAFRMMMIRIAADKALPFEPFIPNATTLAAMAEAEAGGLKSYATVKDLMASLNADD